MIDLHTHILPGLDDGSQEIDDSLGMAELALEGGTDILVATPHSNQEGRFENYAGRKFELVYERLKQRLDEQNIPLRLLLGMEIYASDDLQEKIKDGRVIGLNQTDYYLIEFPFECEQYWIGECLENVLDCGKIPIIAHPERYVCVQEYPALLYGWLRMGCLSQVNKGSLFGRFGKDSYYTVHTLLQNGLVTCIASDAHSSYMRTTYMRDAWEYLEDAYGEEVAFRLIEKNPRTILKGGWIRLHGRIPEQKHRFFW